MVKVCQINFNFAFFWSFSTHLRCLPVHIAQEFQLSCSCVYWWHHSSWEWHEFIINVKEFLNTTCCIKDLGPFRYFLGLEVTTSTQGIAICQRKYWLQLSSCTISKVETIINSYPLSDTSPCRRLLGELLYLTPTKPNISFAVLGGTL